MCKLGVLRGRQLYGGMLAKSSYIIEWYLLMVCQAHDFNNKRWRFGLTQNKVTIQNRKNINFYRHQKVI